MGLPNNLGKLSNMITSTGSAVGIAQTSPSFTLDVTGTGRFTGALTGTSATFSGDLTLNNGSADGGQLVLASSGFSNWNLDNFSGRFRAYYGATEYFTILANGRVGIGTSTPGYLMEIAASSAVVGVGLIINDTNGKAYSLRSDANNLIIRDITASADRLTIASSGNVGIGITSPGSLLDVNGTTAIRGMSGSILSLIGDDTLNSNWGITWKTTTYTGGVAAIRVARRGAADASDMMFFVAPNGDIPNERMRITSGGQVTTPSQTYFYARAALGGQDFSSGSGTILYQNVDYNVGNAYNSSTSTFTAPVSGVYVFSCQMFNRPNSSLWVYWTINGAPSISLETQNDVANFVNFYSTVTRYLAAGDTMRLVITTSSGYVAHVNGSVGPGSFFSGYLLG